MKEKRQKWFNIMGDYGALISLVLIVALISIISPEFRTSGNFLSLLRQSSINGFIAFGMTFVILTGAIDLSVGSVLALSTALCAGMITSGVPAGVAMLASLLIGAFLGLISGVLVTRGSFWNSGTGYIIDTYVHIFLVPAHKNHVWTPYLCNRK